MGLRIALCDNFKKLTNYELQTERPGGEFLGTFAHTKVPPPRTADKNIKTVALISYCPLEYILYCPIFLFYLFKVIRAVFTKGTYKIIGKFFSFINISAYFTTVTFYLIIIRLGFYTIVIFIVGNRFFVI